jgi:hypothetical protein
MTDQERCWHSIVDVPVGEFELEAAQGLPIAVWDMGSQPELVAILHQDVHTYTRHLSTARATLARMAEGCQAAQRTRRLVDYWSGLAMPWKAKSHTAHGLADARRVVSHPLVRRPEYLDLIAIDEPRHSIAGKQHTEQIARAEDPFDRTNASCG